MREPTPEEQQRIDSFAASVDSETTTSQFGWDDTLQSKLLGALLTDADLAPKAMPLVDPRFFSAEAHVLLAGIVRDYWTKYKTLPEKFVLQAELTEKLKDRDKAIQIQYAGQLETVLTFHVPGLHAHQYLLDKLTEFANNQAVKVACHKLYEGLKEHPEDCLQLLRQHSKAVQDILKGETDKGPKLMDCAELLTLPEGDWLVEDHFPTDCVGLIFGKYASLKSFFALEVALSVACGRMFLESHPTKAGAVVYIAGEGQSGLKKRVAAWLKHHGIDKPPENFKLVFHRFNFADPTEAGKLLALVNEHDVSPALVIVDTLARNMVGSENDAETMSAFISSMDQLREGLPAGKPCVLVIHHAGKDETRGSRGYSSLPAAVDVSFELKRKGDGCEVRCDKQKDADEIDPYTLATLTVDLGPGKDGKPVTSLVLVPDNGQQPSAVAVQLHEERQEEEDVLLYIPWLREEDWRANPDTAATVNTIATALQWDRHKTHRVLRRLEKSLGCLRWRKAKEGRTNPVYYWRGKNDDCTTPQHASVDCASIAQAQ